MEGVERYVVKNVTPSLARPCAAGGERVQALGVREAEVEDFEGDSGAVSCGSGGAPDEAFLVLDVAGVGFLVFGRVGELEAACCDLWGGCVLVERTAWMEATYVRGQ